MAEKSAFYLDVIRLNQSKKFFQKVLTNGEKYVIMNYQRKGVIHMIYKTIELDKSFECGVAIGSLRSHLASNGAGELNIIQVQQATITIEISTHNPLVMSYVEDRLADFV